MVEGGEREFVGAVQAVQFNLYLDDMFEYVS